jgi:thymidylate synthase
VHLFAHQLGLQVGEFIWTGGDMHIYNNHISQVETQITRMPYVFPKLKILRKPDSIFDYSFEDFKINNYLHHASLQGKVAV